MTQLLLFIVFTPLFVLLIRHSFFIAIIISQSMLPTFKIGDRVLAFRFWPKFLLRKGHVVIITPLESSEGCQFEAYRDYPWIKRVVATSGERTCIDLMDSESREQAIPEEIIVPPKHLCVNGDANISRNIPTPINLIPYYNFQALAFLKINNENNPKRFEWISKKIIG